MTYGAECPIAADGAGHDDTMTDTVPIRLRPATPGDLDAVNDIIARAITAWQLPERVKRLTLPSYRYDRHDLDHLRMMVAEDAGRAILGVAAWEQTAAADVPAGKTALLLHGLYVHPEHQHRGVGSRLLDAALTAARQAGYDGLLVKARPEAEGFFRHHGLEPVPLVNPERDYPYRFWKTVGKG